jgi:hypothetical protein
LTRPFHIGLDLDNTIISYDEAFAAVGREIGLLPVDMQLYTKDEVKSFLITPERGEQDWMRLQGQVYGRHIGRARLYEGVAEFIRSMRARGARISIVSHKTKRAHFDTDANLWDAARDWLESQGFFSAAGFGLDPANVHFRETRDEKIATIAAIDCQAFVDDLPEVLLDPKFPAQTERFWLAGTKDANEGDGLHPYRDWTGIREAMAKLV